MLQGMNILPIVERELRVGSRQAQTYRLRIGAVLVAASVASGVYGIQRAWSGAGTAGSAIFATLVWMAFLFVLIEGARRTAFCIVEESQEGTLGLLFLSDLTGKDVMLTRDGLPFETSSTGTTYAFQLAFAL